MRRGGGIMAVGTTVQQEGAPGAICGPSWSESTGAIGGRYGEGGRGPESPVQGLRWRDGKRGNPPCSTVEPTPWRR